MLTAARDERVREVYFQRVICAAAHAPPGIFIAERREPYREEDESYSRLAVEP